MTTTSALCTIDPMDPFLPTLLGAFLGISVPAGLAALREWNGFRRALDAVFAQTHAEAQGYLTRSRLLHQQREAGAELGELIAVAVTSLPAPAPSIESFIALYSRFLGSRHVYSLVQDDQNTRIIVANLSSDRFTTIDILFDAIDQIVEFSARRCFRLFQLASKSNVSFSLERYNALVRELDGSVAKRITRISSRGLRCVPRTSPVASIRRCGITANKSGDFR